NPPSLAGRKVEQLFMTEGTARPPSTAKYVRAPSKSEPIAIFSAQATSNGLFNGNEVLACAPKIATLAGASNSSVGPTRVISRGGVVEGFPTLRLGVRKQTTYTDT